MQRKIINSNLQIYKFFKKFFSNAVNSKIINFIGFVISIILIIYLGNQFYKTDGFSYFLSYSLKDYVLLVIPILIYCACITISAFNWTLLFNNTNKLQIFNSHLLTIFLKYIPLNFFHFIGRHLYLNSIVSHKLILTCNMLEIFFMAGISLSISLVLLYFLQMELPFIGLVNNFHVLLLLLSLIMINFVMIVKKIFTTLKRFFTLNLLYIVFHFLSSLGFIVLWVILIEIELDVLYVLKLTSIYLVGWFFGFIAIGSPGGVGVREGIYLALLQPMVSSEGKLLAFLLYARLAIVFAEILMYFLALYLNIKLKRLREG